MRAHPVLANKISQQVAVSVVFVAAMFITIIDTTIVNVAIPTIGRDFHVGTGSLDGVVVGFLVSLAVFIPASGWLGDRFGTKRVLLVAIFIFTVASALCGAAQSLGELVGFRVLQGVGGGLLAPVGTAMLFQVFPPGERLRASSVLLIPTTLAPALGPILGGLFTDSLSWRWVFLVNVPVGALAIVFGTLFLADPRHDSPGRFDLPGFVLAAAGLALLMYGVSEGPDRGWSSGAVLSTCVAGVVALGLLAIVELRTAEPMLDLRLYGIGLYRSTMTVITLMSVSFFGVIYLLALFYQNGLGLSALVSGFNVFPEAIGVVAGAQLITRELYPRLGPRRIMAGGAIIIAVMIELLTTVGPGTSLWAVRGIMVVIGFGMSGIFIPAQAAAFAKIPMPKLGRASTLFNSQQRLGSALGVAAITSIVTAVGPTHVVNGHVTPNLAAYRVGFLVAGLVMLLTAAAALLVNDADAAETMVARKRAKSSPASREQPDQPALADPATEGGT
jgi:EmrB/QacA subfamily drug resistance transporter